MRIVRLADDDYERCCESMARRLAPEAELQGAVAQISAAVRARGDEALLEFGQRFDQVELDVGALRVEQGDLEQALAAVDPTLLEAIDAARSNVRAYAELLLPKDAERRNDQGVRVGARVRALSRVGIYVPGGSAPLISTVVMSVEIARVAGCKEIVVCTPPNSKGEINAVLLAALARCGATEVYRVGGAQAIAAMAYGTQSVPQVQKIFGPGNRFVVEAKRQVFGVVGIDLLPGPSEVMVIADGKARADWIAADLLAQAEHGADSVVLCLSPELALLEEVRHEIERQAACLSRQEQLLAVLEEGLQLLQVRDLHQAVALANDFAPEHLSLFVESPEELLDRVESAGEVFVGQHTPVALGDYLAGPSHTLPTAGAGHAFSGLSVADFTRKMGVIEADAHSIAQSEPYIKAIALAEGLDAHAASASCRLVKL